MIIESHIPRTHYPYSSLKICVSVQSMSHLTPARSQDLHLTSPSRSCLNPGPYVCISPPSWLLSTSIQVHKVASQLHPSTISNQSNFQDVHLTSFQVCKIASEVHPASISNSYWFKMYVWTPCRPCLTSIQIPGYLYHLLPCTIWPQSRSLDPHPTSTSWCRYSCLTSSQAVSHLHPSLKIYVTSQLNPVPQKTASQLHPGTISRLSSIICMIFTSTHVLCQLHPDHKILLSLPSISHLASAQVLIFVSHLHQVSYYLQPALKMCGPPPCRSHLTPYRSRYEYLIPLHPVSPPPRPDIHISPPSRSRFISTHVQIFASLLHLGNE